MSTVLRAAAHVHSAWSDDAHWPLPRIAAAFAERGYDAVLLAEHSRGVDQATWDAYREACAAASTDRMLLVPGIEYNDPANLVHVPVWGDVPFFGNTPVIATLLDQVAAAGGAAVLAHPWRREAWRAVDPAWAPRLAAVEVWNRKYDGVAPNRHAVELANRLGRPAFASIDFHTERQFFPLAVAVEVDAVSMAAVERALRDGRFHPLFRGAPVDGVLTGARLRRLQVIEQSRRAVRPAVRLVRRVTGR